MTDSENYKRNENEKEPLIFLEKKNIKFDDVFQKAIDILSDKYKFELIDINNGEKSKTFYCKKESIKLAVSFVFRKNYIMNIMSIISYDVGKDKYSDLLDVINEKNMVYRITKCSLIKEHFLNDKNKKSYENKINILVQTEQFVSSISIIESIIDFSFESFSLLKDEVDAYVEENFS